MSTFLFKWIMILSFWRSLLSPICPVLVREFLQIYTWIITVWFTFQWSNVNVLSLYYDWNSSCLHDWPGTLCIQFKVWVKPGAEQSFLYGNHVLKSGLGRITENTMQYQGVVVYSMADVPLVCCVSFYHCLYCSEVSVRATHAQNLHVCPTHFQQEHTLKGNIWSV